jgi:hypothetical protein
MIEAAYDVLSGYSPPQTREVWSLILGEMLAAAIEAGPMVAQPQAH